MNASIYTLRKTDTEGSAARLGEVRLPHGVVPTPAFMPVGTQATVKALTPDQLRATGASICLGNTYHLYLRPGAELVAAHGGLHKFMAWDGPILTDSGGFQVFSLSQLRKIDDDGVDFQSHIDGSKHRFTPEHSIQVQEHLGADIIMCFDECPPADGSKEVILKAMERTTRWAERCLEAQRRDDQALFGIVQGGVDPELRTQHAKEMTKLDFPGFAIGGLSVGETFDEMVDTLDVVPPLLPEDKPRYLMGVGRPLDIIEAVLRGVDMFDCVMPTRNARMNSVYTSEGRLNIKNARFKDDLGPLDPQCNCLCCTRFTRAYLRHLVVAKELLVNTLLTIHNLTHYQTLMTEIRSAIPGGGLRDIVVRERALEAQRTQESTE